MDRYSLPHGAKGIEGDAFAIEFRGDKVVFIVNYPRFRVLLVCETWRR